MSIFLFHFSSYGFSFAHLRWSSRAEKGEQLLTVANTNRGDDTSPRVFKMMEDYEEIEFPSDPEFFGTSTTIYVRKTG